MSNQSLANRVQSELKQAVESGVLPDFVQENAQKLLTRLQQPVRLALMGMPGSGKSTLMNLLVGSDVMTDGVRLPTLQLSYGETAQSTCTLPDGSKKVLDTVDAAKIAAQSPVFVDVQMPLPALAKISVLEVVAPDDLNAIQRASQWAAKRCDVALWCTRSFVEAEQTIWASMSDQLKDHSFCMLTRADKLKAEGLLDTALNAVYATAKDEFNQVLAIGTLDAIAARRADGSVDKERMRESGGLALIGAVLKQVDQGRQSAVDMADVLLHQYADVLEAAAPTPPAPQATPTPAVEKPAAAPSQTADAPADAPKTIDAISRLRQMAAEKAKAHPVVEEAAPPPKPDPKSKAIPRPGPQALAPPDAAPDDEAAELTAATREAYQHVIDYIEDQGHGLSAALEDMGDAAPAEVIAMTVEHIQWLCEYLNEHGDETDASLLRARDTAFDAADLVQLMQMEKRDSAALEAVSLMLQIKRELQADLAA